MLVIAQDIAEADELEAIITAPDFAGGEFAANVLTVHSNAPEEALAALDGLEEPGNPYRIVISVGMLKEGWDNKAVYVIASMRTSVSTILTEQTLGRGLRLPFGAYTGREVLDTLEVLAHERYEELLKKAGVINEAFVDRRTRAVLKQNAAGELVPTSETVEAVAPVVTDGGGLPPAQGSGQPLIASVEDHTQSIQKELEELTEQLVPRSELPALQIPSLRMGQPKSSFSLADVTDRDPFEKAGRSIAANPEDELRRTTLSARIVEGSDGLRSTRLVTAPAVDRVQSEGSLIELEDARAQLTQALLAAPIVPARRAERAAAAPMVDAFLEGLGPEAPRLLSAYMDRAAAKLIVLVTAEHGRFKSKVAFDRAVDIAEFAAVRTARAKTSENRAGKFERGVGYRYSKSLFTQDWFDSGPERDVANLLDGAAEVAHWLRLQRNDLPIVWAEHREYNPDFVVVESDGDHFVLEVKMQKEMASADVQAKREAARRWANYVNASSKVQSTWSYLLAGEAEVKTAAGSWVALRKLAS